MMGLSDLIWGDGSFYWFLLIFFYFELFFFDLIVRNIDRLICVLVSVLMVVYVITKHFSYYNEVVMWVNLAISYSLVLFLLGLGLAFWFPRLDYRSITKTRVALLGFGAGFMAITINVYLALAQDS